MWPMTSAMACQRRASGRWGKNLSRTSVGGEGAVAEEAQDALLAFGVMREGAVDGGVDGDLAGLAVAGVEMARAQGGNALQRAGVGGEAAESLGVDLFLL